MRDNVSPHVIDLDVKTVAGGDLMSRAEPPRRAPDALLQNRFLCESHCDAFLKRTYHASSTLLAAHLHFISRTPLSLPLASFCRKATAAGRDTNTRPFSARSLPLHSSSPAERASGYSGACGGLRQCWTATVNSGSLSSLGATIGGSLDVILSSIQHGGGGPQR